jgi:hypothetical protein
MRVYTGQGRAAGAAVLRRGQVSGSGARKLLIDDDPPGARLTDVQFSCERRTTFLIAWLDECSPAQHFLAAHCTSPKHLLVVDEMAGLAVLSVSCATKPKGDRSLRPLSTFEHQ